MKENELASFIKKAGKVQRVIEFECPYVTEFFVKISYANKFLMNQINDMASETSTDFRTNIPIERMNTEKLRDAYSRHITVGWRGLTIKKLQDIIPGLGVDLTPERVKELFPELKEEIEKAKGTEAFEEVIQKVEIPYSPTLACVLFEVSLEFENWVLFTATAIKNYSKVADQKKKELENLK